jgi:metal-dependent hydrolase (beta-lactamase superfamily II)
MKRSIHILDISAVIFVTAAGSLTVDSVAPAHCTGHLGFSIFQKVFKDKYRFFGLGERVRL